MHRNDNENNLNITDTSNIDVKTSFVDKFENINKDKVSNNDDIIHRLNDCENKIKFITDYFTENINKLELDMQKNSIELIKEVKQNKSLINKADKTDK